MSRRPLSALVLAGLFPLVACASSGDEAQIEATVTDLAPAEHGVDARTPEELAADEAASRAAAKREADAARAEAAREATAHPVAQPVASGAPFAASVFVIEPFGPAPGSSEGELEVCSDIVEERYLGAIGPERAAQLDRLLDKQDIVAVTPAFLNACIGLDMADGADVQKAMAITSGWYERQARYKQVVLFGRPELTGAPAVQARLSTLDGWKRWWERTLATDDGVDRFRQRVREIDAAYKTLKSSRLGGN